jgi:hypothetical protein
VKRIFCIIALALVAVVSFVAPVLATAPTLFESYLAGQDALSDNITANTWGYMQFTSQTAAHTVTSISAYIKRFGTPGTCYISLYAASAGAPTGLALVTATFNGDAISTSLTTYNFPVTETSISGATQYAIVILAPSGTATSCISWGIDAGGGIANAVYGYSPDGGLTWTSGTPKDALFAIYGNAQIVINGANVFTGYSATGDWLFVADVNNIYLPYYPNNDPQTIFQLQLVDNVTVKATAPFNSWQRQPMSIYLSPATAGTMTWGNPLMKIRIQSLIDSTVYADYTLLSTDWQGGSLTYLDGYVRNLAGVYQTYYTALNGAATTFLEDSTNGTVFNAAGGVIFSRGIPQLSTIRPNLFKYTSAGIPVTANTVSTGAADAAVIMSDRVGSQIYGMLQALGDGMGLSPVEFASALTWGLMILCAVLSGAGAFAGGFIAGLGFVGIGIVFGSVTFAMMAILVLLAVVVIGLRVFINNSG